MIMKIVIIKLVIINWFHFEMYLIKTLKWVIGDRDRTENIKKKITNQRKVHLFPLLFRTSKFFFSQLLMKTFQEIPSKFKPLPDESRPGESICGLLKYNKCFCNH